jgi:basic membrane protein A
LYNPDVKVIFAYTGSWDDVVKGKELTRSMIDQGADIIYTQSGQVNVGAVEAAAEAGKYAIGGAVDMWQTAPDSVISSALASPGYYVDNLIKMLVSGALQEKGGEIIVLGVKDGVEDLAPYHNFDSKISQDIKDKVAKARQDVIDGKVQKPSDVRAQ